MVDIETMGNGPFAAICAIGAVAFDPSSGEFGPSLYVPVKLESSVGYGLEMNASTVMWWLAQPDAARKALADEPFDLESALWSLRSLYVGTPCEEVWAKPPSFDLVILAQAYRLALGSKTPWDRRMERDARTLFRLVGFEEIKSDDTWNNANRTQHHALDDAMYQAECVMECLAKLRSARA